MNMNFSEIRHDYIWGPAVENSPNSDHDLLPAVYIDAWKSADDNEEGEVLANVFLTAHGDMIVDFHDNGVRMHQPVLDHIRAAEEGCDSAGGISSVLSGWNAALASGDMGGR